MVFRYDTRFRLDSACTRLTDLGYLVHVVEAAEWTSVDDMYSALALALSYRREYGGSLDAMSDVFTDVGTFDFGSDPSTTGTVLAIADFDVLMSIDRRTAVSLLDIFAGEARLAGLNGHPMLCLVESTDTGIGPVTGRPVNLGTVWDVEPDPPDPLGDNEIVELIVSLHATGTGALEFGERLRPIVADLLADGGRWQILDVERAFRIGIRGEGDLNVVSDGLVHRLFAAGLQFDQLSTRTYPEGTEEYDAALVRYPNLEA